MNLRCRRYQCDDVAMIGVFDSGIGGMSVLSEIRRSMPNADLIYVADRGRAPYGTKTLDEVRAFSHEVAGWLLDRGATTIAVACNTASAAALHGLRDRFGEVPIVGMEPAVKPAAEKTRTGTIAVFATAATFQGHLFDSVVDRHAADVNVLTAACPEWVDLVESGKIDGPEVAEAVAARVTPAVAEGADVFVIGCTHFSYLKPVIEAKAGAGTTVYDPAPAVAAQVSRVAEDERGSGRLWIAGSGDLDELERLTGWVAGIHPDVPLLAFP